MITLDGLLFPLCSDKADLAQSFSFSFSLQGVFYLIAVLFD